MHRIPDNNIIHMKVILGWWKCNI